MTNIDLAIEMKKLDIQTIENNSAVAQKELEKLKNTKPISNATTSTPSVDSVTPSAPETPSTDTSVTTPDTVEEKNGDAMGAKPLLFYDNISCATGLCV